MSGGLLAMDKNIARGMRLAAVWGGRLNICYWRKINLPYVVQKRRSPHLTQEVMRALEIELPKLRPSIRKGLHCTSPNKYHSKKLPENWACKTLGRKCHRLNLTCKRP